MKLIRKNLIQALLWLMLGLVPQLAWAEVPSVVNYQGYLENTDGEPLSATVDMTFALYATAQGGSALWTETHQQVEVTRGVFSLILGNTAKFDDESLAGERYLGVTVGGDPEMAPRQQLTSAFFAIRAGVAESVGAATVETESLADGAVTAEKIAPQTITGDKIANLSGHNVTELDDVADAGSGKIISDAEREKLESLIPGGGSGGSPTFENLNVKKELKVGEHTLYLAGDSQGGRIWATGGQKRLALQSNGGNVGIGTPNPLAKLDVKGNTVLRNRIQIGNAQLTWFNQAITGFSESTASSDAFLLIPGYTSTESSDLRLYVLDGPADRFSIWGNSCAGGSCGDINKASLKHFFTAAGNAYHAGNVGIGTNNPQYKLDVAGTIRGSIIRGNSIQLKGGHIVTHNAHGALVLNTVSNGTEGLNGIWFRKSNSIDDFAANYTNLMRITTEGKVGIGTINPQYKLDVVGTIRGNNVSPSDQRLKQNIQPLENSLAKVEQLRGVSFEWKNKAQDAGTQIGMIAQEVETVLPELVATDGEGYKSLAYDKMTAVLLEAVKELKAQNDALKVIVCEDHPEKAICQ